MTTVPASNFTLCASLTNLARGCKNEEEWNTSKTAGQVFVVRNFRQGSLSVMIHALPEDDLVNSIDAVEFVGNAERWCHHVARDQRRPRGTEVRLDLCTCPAAGGGRELLFMHVKGRRWEPEHAPPVAFA